MKRLFTLFVLFFCFISQTACEKKPKADGSEECYSAKVLEAKGLFSPEENSKVSINDLPKGTFLYSKTEALVSFNKDSFYLAEEKNSPANDGSFEITTKMQCKSKNFSVPEAKEITANGLQAFQNTPDSIEYIDRKFLFKAEKTDTSFLFSKTTQGKVKSLDSFGQLLQNEGAAAPAQFYKIGDFEYIVILSVKKSEFEFALIRTHYRLQ